MSINKHVNYSHIPQWNIYQYFRHHICVLDDGVPSNDPAHYGASGGCQGDSGGPMIAEQNTRFVSSVYWFTVLRRCIMECNCSDTLWSALSAITFWKTYRMAKSNVEKMFLKSGQQSLRIWTGSAETRKKSIPHPGRATVSRFTTASVTWFRCLDCLFDIYLTKLDI